MSVFFRIVFYAGLLSTATAAVILFAVVWATARDALRRRIRLHRLRVLYARVTDHAHDLGRRRRIAELETARLEECWRLPGFKR